MSLSRILLLWALVHTLGCSDQDIDSMRNVSGKALSKARDLTDQAGVKLRLGLPRGRGVGESEASRRVQTRLQYDKVLEGADIQAEPGNDGIVLNGHVRSETQRRRAVELAETTAGVGKVIDNLSVTPK